MSWLNYDQMYDIMQNGTILGSLTYCHNILNVEDQRCKQFRVMACRKTAIKISNSYAPYALELPQSCAKPCKFPSCTLSVSHYICLSYVCHYIYIYIHIYIHIYREREVVFCYRWILTQNTTSIYIHTYIYIYILVTIANHFHYKLLVLLSGVPDFFDRNKFLNGGDLSHYQVPHCIRVFFYFVWFVFIHHNFQFHCELCTYCNILDIYLS